LIVSASRRTDIPALYSDWLLNRLRAGEALAPDRFRPKRLYKIDLRPESVDCLVFWTKNPGPLMGKLSAIEDMGYRYYLQYTLNPYGPDIEPGVPGASERLSLMAALAKRLGPKGVVWRYDPVILNSELTPAWHARRYRETAEKLSGLVERSVISFVDAYRHQPLGRPPEALRLGAAEALAAEARKAGLKITACAEEPSLAAFGIEPSSCVDASIAESLTGRRPAGARDRGQRPLCRCFESRDVGAYQSCVCGCVYCYATTNQAKARANRLAHDPLSPTLLGRPAEDAEIAEAKGPKARA
jgi:hypothetical protein